MEEPDEDLVAEAEDSELEEEAEAELEAAADDDSEAEVGAAEVLAGAEEAAEEPEPTLAQKVWTAGRTWSLRNGHVSKGSSDKEFVDGWSSAYSERRPGRKHSGRSRWRGWSTHQCGRRRKPSRWPGICHPGRWRL